MPAEVSYPLNGPQPTLGELRAGDVTIYVRCLRCYNPRWLKPADIRGDDARTFAEIAARLLCGHCGKSDRIDVSLIPDRWVRYLLATNQEDRLPEDSPLYLPLRET